MFWPIAQFINFNFTPAPYRVMYINVLTMLYNVWLSIVKHNDDLKLLMWTQPAATAEPLLDKPPSVSATQKDI